MVVELNQFQFDAFADDFEQRLFARFKTAMQVGAGSDLLDSHAARDGLTADGVLDKLFSDCDAFEPKTLDSFLIYACVALEPSEVQNANPALFRWIARMQTRDAPSADERFRLVAKHLAAMARRDADARRIAGRIDACKRAC